MPSKQTRQKKSKQSAKKPKTLNSIKLLGKSFKITFSNWKLFGPVLILYYVLSLMLVKGFNDPLSTSQVKSFLHESNSSALNNLSLYGSVTNPSSNPGSGVYETVLLILFSLFFIWLFRQLLTKAKPKLRDVFYSSSYPLIPFLLIGFLIALELLPALIGVYLFNSVFGGGIAPHLYEKIIWIGACLLLISLTAYWLSSSLVALYIVTVPDTRPIQALKSAKQLIKGRRSVVIRRVIFLPVALTILVVAITIVFALIVPSLAGWLLYLQISIAVAIANGYLYMLYRELLNE
ncbi:MAG TPA: hypothetical protein VMR34_04760 [Candidatus Saccharimonadales bacterium]|nr:hypothetical protein [Candidatus Saccharimonadales bacterium]